jgi:hypothetical protein
MSSTGKSYTAITDAIIPRWVQSEIPTADLVIERNVI